MTLGAHEVDDLGVAVAHLRARFSSCTIGLWGRSMGAVTALLYSQRDPSIAGVVSACLPAPARSCTPQQMSSHARGGLRFLIRCGPSCAVALMFNAGRLHPLDTFSGWLEPGVCCRCWTAPSGG